ncbi:Tat pathway signal protein [Streptomyces flavofungini]|uniref:Tat pathway signal protein n=1 Tax=Streptomyces flavofungini TaxID=68200 RepID=UPI0025AF5858|nr:Tat pathway signal protein [Streptomyces flavofungini]WJV51656.1 Tat pathway signal protein [Streptomyces flavofungini]
MERRRNEALVHWMSEFKMTTRELVDVLNDFIRELTGRQGLITERTVHKWRSGETRWPQSVQRTALQAVTGRTPAALGFVVPDRHTGRSKEDPSVHRRRFVTAAAGGALAAAAPAVAGASRSRVGMSDVQRLTAKLGAVVASDDRHGGTESVETRASQLARQTLALQQRGTATSRVRGHLYSLAAAFASSAMWAAIDGHRLNAAQQHMQKAVTLAGLSADPAIQFRVWGHAGALYRHLGRYTDALAADDAARSTSTVRRDPLYASLAHARTAVHHGDLRDHNSVKRSLGCAQDALTRADPQAPRPPWMRFYDQAELELLALIAHAALGGWAASEAHAHHNLALLRPDLLRNRSLALAHLARAQLEQEALEAAVDSAWRIPPDAWRGRTGGLMRVFTARLADLAPDEPAARAWADHVRQKGLST